MSETESGLLKTIRSGAGFLRDPEASFRQSESDVYVPGQLIKQYDLSEGAIVTGPVAPNKRGVKLTDVETVCGLEPAQFRERTPFRELTAITPNERFNLAKSGEVSMRMIDMLAPIGKGTRGLIVSPPKAGKTTLLEHLANAINVDSPDARVILFLVDERPEEVTHFQRNVEGEVFASSNDQPLEEHIELTELLLAHIRTELECGRDVVVLMDSLTRMARAFNLEGSGGTGRTLSGGLDAGALQIPRRFFGLARNIEDGGSVTILATALVDTGSRMDDVIFEEFKGTGNSEIVLDRSLAEAYVFPAINVKASGTRKDQRLHDPNDYQQIIRLRRWLLNKDPQEGILTLRKLMEKYPTNDALLERLSEI